MNIRLEGDISVIAKRFNFSKDNINNLMEEIGEIIRNQIDSDFNRAGPGWRPLKPSTVARKRENMGSVSKAILFSSLVNSVSKGRARNLMMQNGVISAMSILIETGALRRSYVEKGAPENVTIISDEPSITVGSSMPYALKHQYGAGMVPARPIKIYECYDQIAGAIGRGLLR